jgi:hypothetical protein
MRMMMKVTMDTEASTRAIAQGKLPGMMDQMMSDLQPEAAYFGPEGGMRTAFIVFDLEDPSRLPVISEPLFATANAKVEMFPVMDREDLKKGLARMADAGAAAST